MCCIAMMIPNGVLATPVSAYREAVVKLTQQSGTTSMRHKKLRLRLASLLHRIRLGEAVDVRDQQGYTALMLAAQAGERHIFELLLEKGSNPRLRAPRDVALLMLAAQGGDYTIFSRVHRLDPLSVAASDAHGTTLFHYACMGGNMRICRELIYAGANPTVRDKRGWTCLHYAAMGGDILVFNDLISKGICPTQLSHDGYDLLMAAAHGGSLDLARTALDLGFVPTSRDKAGNTALMEAARFASPEMASLLMQYGASPLDRDIHGANAPMYAAAVGNAAAFNVMGGNPKDAPDAKGRTPLVYAACGGSLPLVRQMLNAGADPTVLNRMPLRFAVACGHSKVALEIASRLPHVGAEEMRSIPLLTPDDALYFSSFLSEHCTHPGDRAAAAALRRLLGRLPGDSSALSAPDEQYPGNTPLQYAIIADFRGMLIFLLEHGTHVNERNRFGRTALMTAVECNNLFALRQLLRAGANPNHLDDYGMSAIKLAASMAWKEAFDLLQQAGADPHMTRPGSPSTLSCALSAGPDAAPLVEQLSASAPVPDDADAVYDALCQAIDSGSQSYVERIVERWPDVNLADAQGKTLLMHAAASACPDAMLSLLIARGADVNAVDKHHRMPLHYVQSPTKRRILIEAGAIP